jgi:site-specific recombinase XerD
MPTVNFYLKDPSAKADTLVYLQMRYQGNKFVYSCKFSVDPKNWDSKKQLVKSRSATDESGLIHLNTRLKEMREVCLKAFNNESAHGVPKNAALKKHLDQYMGTTQKSGPTLFGLIEDMISGNIGGKKSAGTIKTYQTALLHLKNFAKAEKFDVDFDTVSMAFRDKYIKFLSRSRKIDGVTYQALSPNSISKELKNVATFMNMGLECDYTTNRWFKKKGFRKREDSTDAVYLTDAELRKLFKIDFSGDKRMEEVRDFFVFCSFVGLRYSDARNVNAENIVTINGDKFIKIKSQKTNHQVTIPCNDIVLKIFKKYSANKNHLPRTYSNQKFNDHLKEMGERAGLTEIGRLASDLKKPLYECLTSHTARRSFATNWYLEGMDVRTIMAVTGHSTVASFEKYIKVTRDQHAIKMGEYMKSKRKLKAV